MKIASLRIHEVAPLKDVQKEHAEEPESGIRQLFGWVNETATARACLLACTSDKLEGHEGTAHKNPQNSHERLIRCYDASLQHCSTYYYPKDTFRRVG